MLPYIYIAYMDPMGWIVLLLVLLRQISCVRITNCPTTSLRPHPEWMVYDKRGDCPNSWPKNSDWWIILCDVMSYLDWLSF